MVKRTIVVSLVLSLIMIMVVPVSVGAEGGVSDDSATGIVGYDITSIYSIDLSTTDLQLTAAPNTSTAVSTGSFTITIASNSATYKYGAVTVKGEDGKLSAGSVFLEPSLLITGDPPLGWSGTTISGTETAPQDIGNRIDCSSGSASRTASITQPKVTNLSLIPAGSYSESLTFTVYFYNTNSQ
jgi:hypothetical protein